MRQTVVSRESLLRVGHQQALHQVPGLAGDDGELRDVHLVLALQRLRHRLKPANIQSGNSSGNSADAFRLREFLRLKFLSC